MKLYYLNQNIGEYDPQTLVTGKVPNLSLHDCTVNWWLVYMAEHLFRLSIFSRHFPIRWLCQEFSPLWYLPWVDLSRSWILYARKTPLKGLLCCSSFASTFSTSVTSYLPSSMFHHSTSHFFYLVTVPYKHHEGKENYMLFKLPNLRTVPNHVEVFNVKWICMTPHCSCIACQIIRVK